MHHIYGHPITKLIRQSMNMSKHIQSMHMSKRIHVSGRVLVHRGHVDLRVPHLADGPLDDHLGVDGDLDVVTLEGDPVRRTRPAEAREDLVGVLDLLLVLENRGALKLDPLAHLGHVGLLNRLEDVELIAILAYHLDYHSSTHIMFYLNITCILKAVISMQ